MRPSSDGNASLQMPREGVAAYGKGDPEAEAAAWIESYAAAGATHIMLRFAGDHDRHLEIAAKIKRDLGW